MMNLKPFTSNYADNSTKAGFQFTFYCDLCRDGFKTTFIESKSAKKGKTLKNLGRMASLGASFLGQHRVSSNLRRGTSHLTERFHGMTPEWHKEHEKAFEVAQNEAKGYFTRCPKCSKWVCDSDWNEEDGLCVSCAPRANVEVASARADKRVQDIKEKAGETQVFTGDIEGKQTVCPRCKKPASEGKFCTNCGANMSLLKCENCGTESPLGTRFCGECGERLE